MGRKFRNTPVFVVLSILLIGLVILPITIFQTERNDIRSRASMQSETRTIEGTITIFILDQESGKSTMEYSLRTLDKKTFQVRFSNGKPLQFAPDTHVKLTGVIEKDILTVDAKDLNAVQILDEPRSQVTAAATVKNIRTAVILFNFRNNTRQPFTQDATKKTIFTDTDSIKNYFKEASYGLYNLQGKTSPDGDVFGWYTVPYDLVVGTPKSECANEQILNWGELAKQEAQKAGKDMTGYDKFIFVFPVTNGCKGFVGLSSANNSYIIISDPTYPVSSYKHVFLHEIAHTLPYGSGQTTDGYLRHAYAFSCTDSSGKRVTISNNCIDDAGDPYEPLGGGLGHISNVHKESAGWYASGNIQEVTSAGTYTIVPQEQTSSSVQLIKIPRNTTTASGQKQYYYLEYRQPYGVDQFINFFDYLPLQERPASNIFKGVSIRLAPVECPSGDSCDVVLLDANPATTTFADSALEPGMVFFDGDNKISVQTKTAIATQATVAINFGSTPPTPFFTPQPTGASTITPTTPNLGGSSTILSFTIALHGIGSSGDNSNPGGGSLSNKSPQTPQRNVSVSLFDSTNNNVASKSATITYDVASGNFIGKVDLGSNFSSGTYSMRIKSDRYLQKNVVISLVSNEENALSQISLNAGDVTGDNLINVMDYNAFLDCGYGVINPLPISDPNAPFNKPVCQVHVPAINTDLDDNGKVESGDYNLFLRELSSSL